MMKLLQDREKKQVLQNRKATSQKISRLEQYVIG